jgi:acyl-CoA thioester hydrolase
MMSLFKTKLSVRTYECDLYGHVNNANFLNYLEHARVELLREMGYTLKSLQEKGIVLFVIKVDIEYKYPAYPGDELLITIDWEKKGKTSAIFHQQILNVENEKIVADAIVTWVAANLKGKPIPIPEELVNAYHRSFSKED